MPDFNEAPPEPPAPPGPIIVALGASAGGIEALETFFTHTSTSGNMVFVVIQHLAPQHDSILTELLQRYTSMPVLLAQNDRVVEANTVYVIPPNTLLALFNGKLQLLGPTEASRIRLPIDYFFRSLAEDVHERAVGIVLSGTGSDGSEGLKVIKGEGGIVMVQEPASAGYDGMPNSAIATGLADFILPPDAMPEQLVRYQRLALSAKPRPDAAPENAFSEYLEQILLLIRTQTGHDFSHYKESTIRRRIERLMAVNQIGQMSDYVRFLQSNPIGIEALFRDMLIGVTSFFRDKEFFASVKQSVIPRLFEDRRFDQSLRIWVAGCSTGEEAYSLAILIREHMTALKKEFRVQIFATDIDSNAVNLARRGMYSPNIELDVPEEYLQHYFLMTTEGYQIAKSLREMVVFAPHSIIKDPPFSKVDLISCRNVLIYLNAELQDQVLASFHYALLPNGYLLLGSSESLGKHDREFKVIDAGQKIFQCTPTARIPRFKPDIPAFVSNLPEKSAREADHIRSSINLQEVVESVLLTNWTPTCAVINAQGRLLYVHGQTGKYLEIASGVVNQLDILQFARADLKLPLTTAIHRAVAGKREIYVPGIRVKSNGDETYINLIVKPLAETLANESLLLVIFEKIEASKPDRLADGDEVGSAVAADERDHRYQSLQQEMRDTREYLQATIEELKSSNEEMQSVNEELQSVNEELETSQEELKAVNEELQTSNQELEEKVFELNLANNDLENTFNTLHTGIIMLDVAFQIRRFNAAATRVLRLMPGDTGRSITHIVSDFMSLSLAQEVEKVFNSLVPYEVEAQTRQGQWYIIQIRPYRTLQNAIKGMVLSFNEVTARKQTEAIQAARLLAESIVNTVREPLLMLDASLHVVSANRAFFESFGLTPEETNEQHLNRVGQGAWAIPELIALLKSVVEKQTTFQDYRMDHSFPNIGLKHMLLNARQIQHTDGQPLMILIAIEDDPTPPEQES